MAAIFGQFPANFRFSETLVSYASNIIIMVTIIIIIIIVIVFIVVIIILIVIMIFFIQSYCCLHENSHFWLTSYVNSPFYLTVYPELNPNTDSISFYQSLG